MATFPLSISPTQRYLVDATGVPFPIYGDSPWGGHCNVSPADQEVYLRDRQAKGFTTLLVSAIEHDFTLNAPPLDFASNLPFTKRLDTANYTGSPNGTTAANGNNDQFSANNYSNADTQSPDFTFPTAAYWTRLHDFLTLCEKYGFAILFFPGYVGFAGDQEGFMVEMVANDAVTGAGGQDGQPFADAAKSKLWNYGAWIANDFAAHKNLIWVMGGDYGSGGSSGTFTGPQQTAVSNLYAGIKSVSGQSSVLRTAHWSRPSKASDVTLSAGSFDLESVYSDNTPADHHRNAYVKTKPVFGIETRYEGQGGGTTPFRKYDWWCAVSGGCGFCHGKATSQPTWDFRTGWESDLNSQGDADAGRLSRFMRTVRWWDLVPSGLGGQKTIVTVNGSTQTAQDYVAAAADIAGTVCVAYVPPAWANTNFTVDMTVMGSTAVAWWFDPTNATYQSIGTFANTGTNVFTPPGTNSAGDTDWVLLMRAANVVMAWPGSSPGMVLR